MTRWLRLTTLGISFGLAGCDAPFGLFEGDVEIRIANNSSFTFDRVDVVFPEDEVSYGGIPANGMSDYRKVSVAYRYAYIEVEINGHERVLQPIDYVGENTLDGGRYTYALNLTVEGQLTLDFRKD